MGWMLSTVLREVHPLGTDRGRTLGYWCPGCGNAHLVEIEKPNQWGAKWSFDGNVERPTFAPSINCSPNQPQHQCHHFVKAGRIEYCGDCHHTLRGQTVDMIPWPSDEEWGASEP